MSMFLGTQVIAANTPAQFPAPNDGVKAILIGNESGLTVTITMESGGVQKTLYPSVLDWFDVRRGFTGNIKITPTVILNNVAGFPSSSLIFDAIGLNDSEDASMYPLSLARAINTGNVVTTAGGAGTTFIQNDNNVAGTSIIEATVAADGSSAVKLSNDAVFTLGDVAHPGSLTMAGNLSVTGTENLTGILTAAAANILGTAGNLQHILGTLTVDQLLTAAASIAINPTPVSQNGTTSGTFQLWQPWTGTVKLVVFQQNNYKNSAADPGALVIPTPFTNGCLGLCTNTGTITMKNGAATVNSNVTTTYNSAEGTQATVPPFVFWSTNGAFDRMQPNLNNGSAHNCFGILIGV